jgi:uncharacterized protein (DUF1810 family)
VTFDLDRFTRAQDGARLRDGAREREAGRKRSHWIWCIFPQLAVWDSPRGNPLRTAGVDEAAAYLRDRVLRRDCCASRRGARATQRDPAPAWSTSWARDRRREARLVMTLFREVARRIDDRDIATRATRSCGGEDQGYRECEFTLRAARL